MLSVQNKMNRSSQATTAKLVSLEFSECLSSFYHLINKQKTLFVSMASAYKTVSTTKRTGFGFHSSPVCTTLI